MKVSVLELIKSDYPAITPEAAAKEALRLADDIVKTPFSKDPSFMSGSLGTAVFLCAALRYKNESGTAADDRPYNKSCLISNNRSYNKSCTAADDRSYIEQVLTQLEESLANGILTDLSLASGLCGTIHALILLSRIGCPGDLSSLLILALDRLSAASPSGLAYTDYYLGTAGIVSVLCEIIEYLDSSLHLATGAVLNSATDASLRPALHKMLLTAMEQLLSRQNIPTDGRMLWDLIYTQKPISGLGHGMFGIGAALLRGARILEKVPGLVPKDRIESIRSAGRSAFGFELDSYRPDLTEWPDLRPNGSPLRSLHGICSGAPGIGMGLLALNDEPLMNENKALLERAHDSCLKAALRKNDHLCCGKASLVEYFLTRYALTGERDHFITAGRVLSHMNNERLRCGFGRYSFPAAIPAADTSLFFGSAGPGYEYLRYALPALPPVLP